MQMIKEGFDKFTGQFGESFVTYYTRDPVKVLQRKFSQLDVNQICIIVDEDNGRQNTVCSGLGRELYPVVRDAI